MCASIPPEALPCLSPPCTGELPDVQGLKIISFLGPLAQMVDRDAACARTVLALCAELAVEVAAGAPSAGSAAHKKVGRWPVECQLRIRRWGGDGCCLDE